MHACNTCQRYAPKSVKFQITIPEDAVFNDEAAMDLMLIDEKDVLHVYTVDIGTRFS